MIYMYLINEWNIKWNIKGELTTEFSCGVCMIMLCAGCVIEAFTCCSMNPLPELPARY